MIVLVAEQLAHLPQHLPLLEALELKVRRLALLVATIERRILDDTVLTPIIERLERLRLLLGVSSIDEFTITGIPQSSFNGVEQVSATLNADLTGRTEYTLKFVPHLIGSARDAIERGEQHPSLREYALLSGLQSHPFIDRFLVEFVSHGLRPHQDQQTQFYVMEPCAQSSREFLAQCPDDRRNVISRLVLHVGLALRHLVRRKINHGRVTLDTIRVSFPGDMRFVLSGFQDMCPVGDDIARVLVGCFAQGRFDMIPDLTLAPPSVRHQLRAAQGSTQKFVVDLAQQPAHALARLVLEALMMLYNLGDDADDQPLELNETRVEQLTQAGALSREQLAVLDGVTRDPPDISVTLDIIILAFHPGFDFSQLDDWCP